MIFLKKYKVDVRYEIPYSAKKSSIEFFAEDKADAEKKIAALAETEKRIGYQGEDLSPRFSNIREVK